VITRKAITLLLLSFHGCPKHLEQFFSVEKCCAFRKTIGISNLTNMKHISNLLWN